MESLRDRPGFVVKIVIGVVLGIVLVLCVLDAVSIFRARSQLNDAAKTAATAAATTYGVGHDTTAACTAATTSLHSSEPGLAPGDHFCKIDTAAGTVQVKLHKEAGTILVGRIPFVRRVTIVNAKASAGLHP